MSMVTVSDVLIDVLLHALLCLGVGYLVWKMVKPKEKHSLLCSMISSFAAGLFIDVDHLFDYFMYTGFRFNIKDFIVGSYIKTGKIYIPLHVFEYVILLGFILLFTESKLKRVVIASAMLAMLLHLLTDISLYQTPPQLYFLLYRAANHFTFHTNPFHRPSLHS